MWHIKIEFDLSCCSPPLHTIIVCPKCLSAACYCANSVRRRFWIPARVVIGEISILEMTVRSPGPTLCWLVSHALMHVLERTPGRKHAPDAHAHCCSTDVGTLCADLLMQLVLGCRAAASFASLTWNLSHVFQLKTPAEIFRKFETSCHSTANSFTCIGHHCQLIHKYWYDVTIFSFIQCFISVYKLIKSRSHFNLLAFSHWMKLL